MAEHSLLIACAQPERGALALHRLEPENSAYNFVFESAAYPSFLGLSTRRGILYVVSERPKGHGSVTPVARQGASLSALAGKDSGGQAAVHLCLDRQERFLFVANYQATRKPGDVSVSVFPILDNGALGPAVATAIQEGHGPDAKRQEAAHCHSVQISPDNRFLVAADLGTDSLFVYRFDAFSGALERIQELAMPPGCGPRHCAFHPSGGALYVTGELDSTMLTLRFDQGRLSLLDAQPATGTNPGARNYPSGVAVTPDGHYVLAANRGADSVAVFWVDPQTLKPRLKGEVDCGGKFPRALRFDRAARRIAVANQKSNTVAIFDWDYEKGMLGQTPSKRIRAEAPMDMLFLDDQ